MPEFKKIYILYYFVLKIQFGARIPHSLISLCSLLY